MKKRKNKKRTQKVCVRRFSAVDIQNIRILAEMLGELLPYSGYKSRFNIVSIAKKRGLSKYLSKGSSSKKEALVEFIRKLHKDKPRTIKIIVREIMPQAIERRHSQGNPILFDEAGLFVKQLCKLGIDLRKEILALNFPKSRPTIVPPPFEIQDILKKFSLHPLLMPDCQKLFLDGHINEAVRKALEKFETYVQKKSGSNLAGIDLMGKVFNLVNPLIKLNSLSNKTEQCEQEGFMHIAMGIMQWWRNSLSHGDIKQIDHQEALGRLFLASNLLRRLDEVV
jgi:uncharacterized protein (TIGR02391 family)